MIVYPKLKKYTNFVQLFLAITFNWSIVIVFLETKKIFSLEFILLYLANFFWIVSYDTQYAMVDMKYDIKIGIKSTAILFKDHIVFFISILQFLKIFFLICIGIYKNFNFLFYFFNFLIFCTFLVQNIYIRKKKDKYYYKAFLNNNFSGIFMVLSFLQKFF